MVEMKKKIYNNAFELFGNTPLVQISDNLNKSKCKVVAKLEYYNPTKSVKDRLGYALIEAAEKQGLIDPKTSVIIEPTSGNTGISLACYCAIKKYKLILTMPETMSLERRQLLEAYGAKLVLTEGKKGIPGAIAKAKELAIETKNSFVPLQFDNEANVEIHQKTTAIEIWNDTAGEVDIFIAGVGTGGTISGVSSILKEKKKDFKAVSVEPFSSPVLSGGKPGPHKIQGIGAGFIPSIYKGDYVDEIFQVTNEQAVETSRQLALQEGILGGISSGATAYAALEIAKRKENEGKMIVFIVASFGERYLSSGLYDNDIFPSKKEEEKSKSVEVNIEKK